MSVELALLLALVVTILTGVPHAEMFVLNMSFHHFASSNLVVTLLTGVHLPLVFLLEMSRGVGLEGGGVLTLGARVDNTLMLGLHVEPETHRALIGRITDFTFKLVLHHLAAHRVQF